MPQRHRPGDPPRIRRERPRRALPNRLPRRQTAGMRAPTISLRNITRRFGPVVANDDVSLDLPAGRIHALVGENGAGKTTLMRVLYGLLIPDAGRIEVDGRVVSLHRPADAMRLGLGMVHQHFMLV